MSGREPCGRTVLSLTNGYESHPPITEVVTRPVHLQPHGGRGAPRPGQKSARVWRSAARAATTPPSWNTGGGVCGHDAFDADRLLAWELTRWWGGVAGSVTRRITPVPTPKSCSIQSALVFPHLWVRPAAVLCRQRGRPGSRGAVDLWPPAVQPPTTCIPRDRGGRAWRRNPSSPPTAQMWCVAEVTSAAVAPPPVVQAPSGTRYP